MKGSCAKLRRLHATLGVSEDDICEAANPKVPKTALDARKAMEEARKEAARQAEIARLQMPMEL